MRFLLSSLAVATTVSASLEVRLAHLDGTRIKASVTNTGAKGYNLLSRGSILDTDPVRKLDVKNDTSNAPFHGMSKACSHGDLSQDDFKPIAAGQTIDHDFDLADLYDLNDDIYYVSTKSLMPYAEEDSVELTGDAFALSANELQLTVQPKNITVHSDLKRNTIESDCSSSQRSAVETANEQCASLANAAADAAESGSEAVFEEFFKDTAESTRSQVAANYRKVAEECSSTPGGTATSYCTDQQNACSGSLLAYTTWRNAGRDSYVGTTYYCPRYFQTNILGANSRNCNEQSQASNTLHETTHAVLATQDIAYGLSQVKGLSSSQALQNADTYTFYAIAVDLDCSSGGSSDSGFNTGRSTSSGGGSSSNGQGSNSNGGNFGWF